MPYQLVFTDDYTRRALRFLKRHPELKAQYTKTLALLEANPHHPSLRLRALTGRLQDLHSVSTNVSYRITLELLIKDQQIIPINVGDHDGAQRAIEQAEVIRLSMADQQCFADALLSPPQPQPALKRALARRSKLLRTD